MNHSINLSTYEWTLLLSMVALVVGLLLTNALSKNKMKLWSPMTMVALVMLYYAVIGPLVLIDEGKTYYKLVEHRPYYSLAMELCLVGFASVLVGFNLFWRGKVSPKEPTHDTTGTQLRRWGMGWLVVALTLSVLGYGPVILLKVNPFNDTYYQPIYQGTISNYLFTSVVLLVPAVLLLFLAARKGAFPQWLWLLIFVGVLGILISSGFRYRLFVALVGLAATYYLYADKRPNLVLGGAGVVLLALVMGYIQETRNYHYLRTVETDVESSELLSKGAEESIVFYTSGYVVDDYSRSRNFTGFFFLEEAVAMPIPRAIWPGKPSGQSFKEVLRVYGTSLMGSGAAYFNFTEYFVAFGWPGVVVFSFLFGMVLRLVWRWFLLHRRNPFVVGTYAAFFAFIYIAISRGYLAQVVMLFFFLVFPIWVAWQVSLGSRSQPRKLANPVIPSER